MSELSETPVISKPNEVHWLLSHQAPVFVGCVTLVAKNLGAMADFYQRVMGLTLISASGNEANLGSGGFIYLKLIGNIAAEFPPPQAPGLFHTAFLVPSRADLGAFLAHTIRDGMVLDGASDHDVSEAIYLSDLEGNGIEIYVDRPRSQWVWNGTDVQMSTKPLNVRDLLAKAAPLSAGSFHIAGGTRIGHVHLKVPEISAARQIFEPGFGLDVTHIRPGAAFFSSGGYHHHLASNVWQSAGAPPRHSGQTGLAEVALYAQDEASFHHVAGLWSRNGGTLSDGMASIDTDWGGHFTLELRPNVF